MKNLLRIFFLFIYLLIVLFFGENKAFAKSFSLYEQRIPIMVNSQKNDILLYKEKENHTPFIENGFLRISKNTNKKNYRSFSFGWCNGLITHQQCFYFFDNKIKNQEIISNRISYNINKSIFVRTP